VRAVHAALGVGDLNALRELYTGADWAGQAHLLEQPSVRSDVLTVLRTHPANLGEGYVYPGFSTTGWGRADRPDRRDGARAHPGVAAPEPTFTLDIICKPSRIRICCNWRQM